MGWDDDGSVAAKGFLYYRFAWFWLSRSWSISSIALEAPSSAIDAERTGGTELQPLEPLPRWQCKGTAHPESASLYAS